MDRQRVMSQVPTALVTGPMSMLQMIAALGPRRSPSQAAFSPPRACWTVIPRATALAVVAAAGCWEAPPAGSAAALAGAPGGRVRVAGAAEAGRRCCS